MTTLSTATATATATAPGMLEGGLAQVRLMHLISPSLPTGGFTYSQGIEWAVAAGWIRDAADLEDWVSEQLAQGLAYVDLALLPRMQRAAMERDADAMRGWVDRLLAARETAELRREESARGRALADLLVAWGLDAARDWRPVLANSQAAGFAFAADAWRIEPRSAQLGYAWSWLEGLVLAGVKLVPLGQTEGQRLLARVGATIPRAVSCAAGLSDEEIGAAAPALAIASAAHETLYTRLFRS